MYSKPNDELTCHTTHTDTDHRHSHRSIYYTVYSILYEYVYVARTGVQSELQSNAEWLDLLYPSGHPVKITFVVQGRGRGKLHATYDDHLVPRRACAILYRACGLRVFHDLGSEVCLVVRLNYCCLAQRRKSTALVSHTESHLNLRERQTERKSSPGAGMSHATKHHFVCICFTFRAVH